MLARLFLALRPRSYSYITVLRSLWIFLLFISEFLVFRLAPSNCAWPVSSNPPSSSPFKVLVITDPQILTYESYPGRPSLLMWLTLEITDAFARKSFKSIMKHHQPDALIFLGDLLDTGVETTDPRDYELFVERFRNIFAYPSYSNHPLPTIFIPGNHDRGLSSSIQNSVPLSRTDFLERRFARSFGPINGQKVLGNHEFVWFDSQKLVEEVSNKAVDPQYDGGRRSVISFLEKVSNQPESKPRILLSHIPLWRPHLASCGSLREQKNIIFHRAGKNYQNLLDKKTSEDVVHAVDPILILSGDDHDYCDVYHNYMPHEKTSTTRISKPSAAVREITVKAFSMAMGIRRPGYLLLTLHNSTSSMNDNIQNDADKDLQDEVVDVLVDEEGVSTEHKLSIKRAPTLETRSCILPDQARIYLHIYLPFFIFTILCVIFFTIRQEEKTSLNSSKTKIKDDDYHDDDMKNDSGWDINVNSRKWRFLTSLWSVSWVVLIAFFIIHVVFVWDTNYMF